MSFFIVRLDSVKSTPWRNGGGITRELMAWPIAGPWRWRMSVAEVAQSGPFSAFEGVQRWFAVLAGAGVRLHLGGQVHALTQLSDPFVFDGGVPPRCELIAGSTQDFNLMVQGTTAVMERVSGRVEKAVAPGVTVAVYAYGTGAGLRCGGEAVSLPPHSLAVQTLKAEALVEVSSPHALWMEIAP